MKSIFKIIFTVNLISISLEVVIAQTNFVVPSNVTNDRFYSDLIQGVIRLELSFGFENGGNNRYRFSLKQLKN